MGRLIDGRWSTGDLGADERGRFVRRAAKFRNKVTADGSSGFPAEADRYHMYVQHACGWSHRALIARALKGLDEVVPISVVHPFMGEDGWTFEGTVDPIQGKTFLYEVYTTAQSDYTGRASVPVLWDKKKSTIVSNESIDIVQSFDREFGAFTRDSAPLFPKGREQEIEAMMQTNYEPIQNGVYKAGFAANQEAHEEAVRPMFARLDELEQLLGRQRYLLGNEVTAADWYLFPTIYRFDTVYYIHFKCSVRRITDYPNLWGWTRDLYQTPGIAATCSMDDIKRHYYTSHESVHPRRYIPLGPDIDFDAPHDRGRF
jgi:putative glutathione S-transferase